MENLYKILYKEKLIKNDIIRVAMRGTRLLTILTIALVIAIGMLAMFYPVPLAQAPSGIVAYKVVGSANLAAPGTESFWKNIPAYNVSLVPNLSQQMIPISYNVPTSGLVPYVLVKAAWNGTDIFILME